MPPILRRLAVIVVLIAAGALLTACGKSAHFGATGSAAARSRSGGSVGAGKLISKTQAKRLAPLLNLQASDLPEFKVSSEHGHGTPAEKGLERKLLLCMGGQSSNARGAGALAEASSKSFERQAQVFRVSVSSSVTIVATPAQAARELRAIRSKQAQACLTRYLRELLAGETRGAVSATLKSFSMATPPASGTSGTFAWRIAGEITAHSAKLQSQLVKLPFYIELVGFDYGQEEVQLLSFAVPAPFPASAEGILFSLLVERAKAGGSAKRGPGAGAPKTPSPSGPRNVQI